VIKYRAGYKYLLAEDYKVKTDIIGYSVETKFIKLTLVGVLTIKAGYAWDGPSGPTFDTKDFMRGSLVHDCLYQLMREKHLPQSEREFADKELKKICLEDGMPEIRAMYVFAGVNKFGKSYADPANEKKVLTAP
jgi:hypothetical protein